MEEYHEEAIRLGFTCLYMTDLSLKQSLYPIGMQLRGATAYVAVKYHLRCKQ